MEQPIGIAVAKQKEMHYANYSGTIYVFSNVENVFKKITFRNVLFEPDLLYNLFSIQKIEEKGIKITFYNAKVLIQQDDNLVAMGERNDKMYHIKFNMYMHDSANANLVTEGNADLWHHRLGHLCKSNFSPLIKEKMDDGINISTKDVDELDIVCESCVGGKQTRRSFKERLLQRLSRSMELVHMDIGGPISPGKWDNKRYFLTFIDDYTHFGLSFVKKKGSIKIYYAI